MKNHYWTTKQNLICLDKVINSIFWAFHKKSTWTYLSLRTKTHEHLRVGGELILFCFSKLKLKYFLYLSLNSSVYDSKSHKASKFALSIVFQKKVLSLFGQRNGGGWARKNSNKWLQGVEGVQKLPFSPWLHFSMVPKMCNESIVVLLIQNNKF